MDPLKSGVSPETPAGNATPPPNTGESPVQPDSPSGQPVPPEVQIKELRRKVTEQGEANKRLRAFYERATADPVLVNYFKTGKLEAPAAADGGDDFSQLDSIAAEVFEKGDAGSFAKALRMAVELGEKRATGKVMSEMAPHLRRQVNSTINDKATEFFTTKGLPELAEEDSSFMSFMVEEARAYPWFRTLVNEDLDAAFDTAWSRYTKVHGDPAKERARLRAAEQRKLASLEDSSGLPADMRRLVQKGGTKSLYEIFQEIEGT